MAANQNSTAKTVGFAGYFVELLKEFSQEFTRCWNQLPNKGLFFGLLAAWSLLFQFLGNGTFGYIDTASLFKWLFLSYTAPGSDDGHGVLIPLVVLALFWWKRNQLLALPPRAWTPALVLLAVALSLHVVAYLIQQPLASTVALFVGIFALIGVAWGPGWMKASIFPFGLFVFSLPTSTFAQPITFQLRLLVAKLVSAISSGILGLNVIREGTQLFNSTHTYGYEVAAACSGLRSSIAIFALSTIYGFITFEKNWKRVVMMAAAFPLAIIGNTIRMMTIIVAAELYGQKGGDFVHENTFFSMVPYVPAIIGVIALAHWLREKTPEAPLALNPKPA